MNSHKRIKMKILRVILFMVICVPTLFGAKASMERWAKGETFSDYLESRNISLSLIKSISKEDVMFLSDIESNQAFYELRDNDGLLEQALIPIGEEMQIQVAKAHNSKEYHFDIIPIAYKQKEYKASVSISKNLSIDTARSLNFPALGEKIGQLFKDSVDATKFKKGDEVSFVYEQKTRMGRPFLMPFIKIAVLESKGKKQFIYADEEGYGYMSASSSKAYSVLSKKKITFRRKSSVGGKRSRFGMPLRNPRITSSFTHRRFHPILKRYRPHHGTDFGAKRGTPLLAVNAGKVTFSGWMGGYGKVVKIRHGGGYESLYAHQSRTRVKRGQMVKKGQTIGYVGSTGRSTGPHLHFGLKKRGRWVNPMRILGKHSVSMGQTKSTKKVTSYQNVKTIKYKKVIIKDAKENRVKLLKYIKNKGGNFVWQVDINNSVNVNRHEI